MLAAGCIHAGPSSAPDVTGSVLPGPDGGGSGTPPQATPGSAPTDPSPPPADPVSVARPVFRQSGCQSFYSHHAVPVSYARENLPPGFEPFSFKIGATTGALFTSKLWRCERSVLGDVPVDANEFLLYYLATTPPDPYRNRSVGFYWYPLEVIAGTQAGADIFRSWTIGVAVDGDVMFDHLETAPSPSASGKAQSSNTTVEFAAFLGPAASGSDFNVRYFGSVDGHVTGAVDIIVHRGQRASGDLSLLRIEGAKSPWATWDRGTAEYQGWAADALSYTWTYVPFAEPG